MSSAAADLNGDGVVGAERRRRIDEAAAAAAADRPDRARAQAGLLVHTWTFRNEQRRLVSDYAGNPVNEYLQFYRLGIDGVFSGLPGHRGGGACAGNPINEYLQLYRLGIDGVFADFADTAVVARVHRPGRCVSSILSTRT